MVGSGCAVSSGGCCGHSERLYSVVPGLCLVLKSSRAPRDRGGREVIDVLPISQTFS